MEWRSSSALIIIPTGSEAHGSTQYPHDVQHPEVAPQDSSTGQPLVELATPLTESLPVNSPLNFRVKVPIPSVRVCSISNRLSSIGTS